ncbi:lysophospholipid acyltransferase family protein [[Clostridium] polysaccharolyticum]|uniref:1-acyl-sn-glycerol-3-phosphate acyltransferase n=1 Tax=[Clostridium] polysaccharolyticum TaxID=29364 RepID=A0A1I0BLJ7_9FIRM|nr:lysophospholipid acyltransferase family protein [[Clostridium] polysaccharolyticum]SET07826.1 1-acyl-sn-glycerol-3-phosphate acyltransferase [[Clostridium] polysaccharolyticum]
MRTLFVLIFLILYFIYSIPSLFIIWLIGKITKNDRLVFRIAQAHVAWAFGVICFLSGVKRTVVGLENIPTGTPVLYVANHRGFFDIIVSYSVVPNLTSFVSKKEIEKVPFIRQWMQCMKCLFLNRDNIKEGMKTILTGIEQIKKGYSIFIMPEGTRNHTDKLLPFHEGSFKFAQKTGCPIIPVALTNTDKAFENHLPFVGKANVTIMFGEPIYLDQLSKEDKKFVGSYTQKIIQENLDKINSGMIK